MSAHDPEWDDLWAEAKQIDIRAVAERLGAKLKREGHDWIGPCPAGCARRDGFVVTLWTYYPSVTPPEVAPVPYANALKRLHAGKGHR